MCGLFGYLGKKQKINFGLLNMLGIDNDVRGGDSCGIFIDGEVEYGTGINKYYENFYNNSKLLKKYDGASIILGHDRKASVGHISEETAQPVVIYNDKQEVDFVMIHNGTITNYIELSKKYLGGFDYHLTDSQIIAQIVYKHGYDVLSEYDGSGAFVFVDYRTKNRKPQYCLFKGASSQTIYSTEIAEERPLFYIHDVNGIWFSSISTVFHAITYKKDISVYKLPVNKLLTFENGKLTLIKEYDRSKKIQKISYSSSNYIIHSNHNWDVVDNKTNTYTTNNTQLKIKSFDYDKNKIYMDDDFLYCVNGEHAHGMLIIDKEGNVGYKGDIYHFYDGILLYNYKIYDALTSIQEDWQIDKEEFSSCAYSLIYSFSNCVYFDPLTSLFYRFYGGKMVEACGKYTPFFNYENKCYVFDNGSLVKLSVAKQKPNKEFQHAKDKFNAMSEQQIKDKMELMFNDLM